MVNNYDFLWLINNSYMEKQAAVIRHPMEQPYHKKFLKKLEKLRVLAKEVELIFKGKAAIMYSDFVFAYQEAIYKIYQYKIVIDKIEKESERQSGNQPTKLDVLVEKFGEDKHRKELSYAMETLKQKYIMIMDYNVDSKIEKQIRLKLLMFF